jgi:hypothetical protein
MSIFSELFIETSLSLQELATLLGSSIEKELPSVLHNRTFIGTDLMTLGVLIMSDKEYDSGAPYGISSTFCVTVAYIYYEEFLKLVAHIVKTTPYNFGVFMDFSDIPRVIRKDQKLTLNSNPNVWTEATLAIFKDIPHEMAEF